MVLDRVATPAGPMLELLAPYIDVVKVGWGIPLLLEQSALRRRIHQYRRHGVSVSNGGTMLELAVSRGRHLRALEEFVRVGFDTIEVSEGVIDIPTKIQREIVEFVHAHELRLHWEVGRKTSHNQLSLEESVLRVRQAIDFHPRTIIIEGRESGKGVEIFDETGAIKWDWVDRFRAEVRPALLMFETPLEIQQTEMVLRLGSDVNLGNIAMGSVAALESQRQGYRGDTFGVVSHLPEARLSPAAKFVFHILRTHGVLDQSKIMAHTGLNRRTVQYALDGLVKAGLVRGGLDSRDLRRRVYSCAPAPPAQ
jgi:phosphosulfolactate synthase